MTTVENVTIFKCDFCKKELKRKYSMILHESICGNNPINFKACMNMCQHLTKKKVFVAFEIHVQYEPDFKDVEKEVFYCMKKDQLMYPFGIERRNLPNKYPETYGNQEAMPNNCSDFKEIDYVF